MESSQKQLSRELEASGLQPIEAVIDAKIKEKKIEVLMIEREFATAEASVSLERLTEIERTKESVEKESNQVESRSR